MAAATADKAKKERAQYCIWGLFTERLCCTTLATGNVPPGKKKQLIHYECGF